MNYCFHYAFSKLRMVLFLTGNLCLLVFHLQTDINDCAPNPCEGVGSSCTDLVNDFTCTCQAGLTGKSCQVSFFF